MRHFIALAVIALVGCTLVQGSVLTRRDAKADLIKKGEDLLKKADAEIKKLSADTAQAHEVTVLKSEEAKIKKLVADLNAATEAAAITKLEHELNTAENKLAFEIKKIESKTPVAPAKDPKAALLKKAQALEKQAEELIKKLTEEKKDTEVAELKKEEELVKKLVKELQGAEATDLAKVEKELAAAEAKLAKEIKKDTPAPAPSKRDAKADLLKKGQDLLKQAEDEIKKLSADPKQAHEVTVVKSEEAKIKKLVADLEAATDAAKITKLEADLNTAENKLAFEIKKIEAKASPKDQKEKLLKKAQALEKSAEELIKKLTEEKKDAVVAELKKDEELVKKLVKDLTDAKEGADLTTIEKELTEAEKRLNKEIKKDTPAKRDAKADLIKKGQDLLKKADAEIKKLSADAKQAHEVTVLKAEEAKIKKLVADLEAATEAAAITKLEHDLNTAENKLAFEIKKLESQTPVAPAKDQKAALLKKAQTLEKQAEELIKKLTEEKKDTEVAELKKEEELVKKLVKELQGAEATDLAKVEKELAAAEAKLAKEIKKDTPTPAKRDAKSDLIKKGEDLLKKADAEIKKLSADAKQAHEVTVLKSEEAKIKKLVADLNAATEAAAITKLEHELNTAENKLAFEIKKIETKTPVGPAPAKDQKAALLKKAQTLENQAEELIKKLTEEKKDTEVAELKKEEELVKKLVKELQGAEATDLAKVEKELAAAEAKLAKEIKKDTPAPAPTA